MTRPWPDSPFLALDLDAFERYVKHLADTILVQGGKQWRPHTKALRSPEIAKRLIAAGAHGVTRATAWEAQSMVGYGVQPAKIVVVARQGNWRQPPGSETLYATPPRGGWGAFH